MKNTDTEQRCPVANVGSFKMVFVTNPMFDLQECHCDEGGMLKWGWTLLDPESPQKVPRRPRLQWTLVDFSGPALQ